MPGSSCRFGHRTESAELGMSASPKRSPPDPYVGFEVKAGKTGNSELAIVAQRAQVSVCQCSSKTKFGRALGMVSSKHVFNS